VVGTEAHEYERRSEVLHSVHSYISKHLLIVSTEWTRLINKKILIRDHQIFLTNSTGLPHS